MEASLDYVPPRLSSTLYTLLTKCRNDERVRSVWIEGSLARGSADDWSDIDLHLAVKEPENFDAIEWLESEIHLVLADAIPGLADAFICLTSDWIHIDLNVHSLDVKLQDEGASRVLLDRDGLIRARPEARRPPDQPFFPAQDVQIFLYFLGTTVASVHRGDVIALSRTTAMMRDRLLVNLLLAENGIQSEIIIKRAGWHLNEEQMQCLGCIPAFSLSEPSIREAQQTLAVVYLSRARKLAVECEADWPTELEQATKQLLHRELQMVW